MSLITLDELRAYFKRNIGPVFCLPSKNMLFAYAKTEGMLGLVVPFTGDGQTKIKVDWSLDKEYKNILQTYGDVFPTYYHLLDINILTPGFDIPDYAADRFIEHDWKPSKHGQHVCISDYRLRQCDVSTQKKYAHVTNLVGNIKYEKCRDDISHNILVTFYNKELAAGYIINAPIELLNVLPESFTLGNRTTTDLVRQKTTMHASTNKPKLSVGDIVRTRAGIKEDSFVGLLGIISEVHKTEKNYLSARWEDYEYSVDFDTLPTRNLSLCEGEGDIDITAMIRVKEMDLEEHNPNLTDKMYLSSYREINKRMNVWVPFLREKCKVQFKSTMNPSKIQGLPVQVKVDKEDSDTIHHIHCRELDYLWNKESLSAALTHSSISIGVEEDKRNPNEKLINVYMYLFDYPRDIGKYLKYRIYLGTLVAKQSLLKKFSKSLLKNKFTHPWNIYRYLEHRGYFYEIFTANEYIKICGEFSNVE